MKRLKLVEKYILDSISMVFYCIIIVLAISCNSKVELKITDNDKYIYFSRSSDFQFNSNYIEFSGGQAAIKELPRNFSKNEFLSGVSSGVSLQDDQLTISKNMNTHYIGLNESWTPRWDKIIWYWNMDGEGLLGTEPITVTKGGTTCETDVDSLYHDDGIADQSLYLNGRYTRTECDASVINSITDQITISGWLKYSEDAPGIPWFPLLGKNSSGRGFNIHREGTGNRIYLRVDTDLATNRVCYATGHTPLDGDWYHIAFTINSGTISAYVNGEKVNTCTYSHGVGFGASSGVLSFINLSSTGKMKLDEWAFWSEALDDHEVFRLYDFQKSAYTDLNPSWISNWDQIVGHWKLDENWKDSSPSEKNLTPAGAGATINIATPRVGSANANFDGSTYADSATGAEYSFPDTTFSISFWLKTLADGYLITNGADANGGWAIRKEATGQLSFYIRNPANDNIFWRSDEIFLDNSWHFITFVVTTDTVTETNNIVTAYIDGRLATGSMTYPGLGAYNDPGSYFGLEIGARLGGNSPFTGGLDDITIWSTGLSAQEIFKIFNRQKQKFAGHYESPIYDMGSAEEITNLSARTKLPFYKEITAEAESNNDYSMLKSEFNRNLLSYWSFEEISGNFTDKSSNSNTISPQADIKRKKVGFMGSDVEFARLTNSYITSPSFDLGDKFTIATWFKLGTQTSTESQTIITNTSSSPTSDGFSISINNWNTSNGSLIIQTGNGTLSEVISTGNNTITAGKWYHLVIVIDKQSANAAVYLDGEILTTSTIRSDFSSTGTLEIGRNKDGVSYLTGEIDEMAIWSRDLTDGSDSSVNEIRELYQRSANRVKYQVRTCDDLNCTTSSGWRGPGGDETTFFSELLNKEQTDLGSIFTSCYSGTPDICDHTEIEGLIYNTRPRSLEVLFSDFPTFDQASINTRYFQYKVLMESEDNNACSGETCLPSLDSLHLTTQNDFFNITESIQSNSPVTITSKVYDITADITGNCIDKYQFSRDGTNFYYFEDNIWKNASEDISNANELDEVSSDINSFIQDGALYIKVYLKGDGVSSCKIRNIRFHI